MATLENPFEKFESLKTINVTDPDSLTEIYEDLLATDISTQEGLMTFLKNRDVVEKHVDNEMAESYFLMAIDVSNEDWKKRQEHCDEVIHPIKKKFEDELNNKFLNSKLANELKAPYDILRRNKKMAKEIFCAKNIEIEIKNSQLRREITEIQGKQTALWEGEERPLPEIYPVLKDTHRPTRKKAFEAITNAKVKNADIINQKFDQLLALRQQVATNAGFKSYTEYRFKEKMRFDWGVNDCINFHKAVRKHIVPLLEKLNKKKIKNLGIDSLMPYDTSVNRHGLDPIRIYEKGHSELMVDGAEKIIKNLDSELHACFLKMKENKLFDLDVRKNKAPGGFMVMYPIPEMASVFYNGAGLSNDLLVFLHELGHCFHYFLGKNVKPFALQDWTSEVAEGGSMSMEYMGLELMHHYLDEESCKRIKEARLESVVHLLCSSAKIDEFQHWLYANPGHSVLDRQNKYIELTHVYDGGVDYGEYETAIGATSWQFIHILHLPFYYIDYSISELLALSIWDRFKKDPVDALQKYKAGCSLAASKSVTEIYQTFGTKLCFDESVLEPLAKTLTAELDV